MKNHKSERKSEAPKDEDEELMEHLNNEALKSDK
jgi:hypothetical protein